MTINKLFSAASNGSTATMSKCRRVRGSSAGCNLACLVFAHEIRRRRHALWLVASDQHRQAAGVAETAAVLIRPCRSPHH